MNPTIDPTIKALVSAIGQAETGTSSPEAYRMRGKSGEYGRYQFTPDTWQKYAGELGISTPLEQSSIEEQNKVAYQKVAQWKQQGYNPAQIASMWNAGEGEPNAYKGTFTNGQPAQGVNKYNVQYNVPEYTRKVSEAYQRLKGETGGVLPPGGAPIPGAQGEGDGTFMGDVGETFARAGSRLSTAVGQGLAGQINPLSATIQGVGALAGGVGDLTTNVLEHTPIVGTVFKGIEGLIGKGVEGFAGTEGGQKLITNYQQWAQAHPEAAGNVGSLFDVATAIPILKGVGAVKNVAKEGIDVALRGLKNEAYETVAPRLGPKGLAKAIQERGTVQKGLLRQTELAPDPYVMNIAKAVEDNVPKFNPKKSLLFNIGETQKVATAMKDQLKKDVIEQGANRIYPKKELLARLKKLEKPDLIASDATLNNVYDRLIKRVENLMQTHGGKVENLLDLRQDFDRLVKRQFPNLYKSEQLTPMRQAVGDIRDAITDFTVENLPEGAAFRQSLLIQHQLIKAIENMSAKAAIGSTKEIGKGFLDKHPVVKGLVKTAPKALLEGAGVGGVIKLVD